MSRTEYVLSSSLLAGPVFVLTYFLLYLGEQASAPEVTGGFPLAYVLGIAGISTVLGAVVALPITAIGAAAMHAFGEAFAPARTHAAWALAGGLLGCLFVLLLGAGGQIGFALVASSIFCGWLSSFDDR